MNQTKEGVAMRQPLIALAQWRDSPLHGFRNSKSVMEGVVVEMIRRVNASGK